MKLLSEIKLLPLGGSGPVIGGPPGGLSSECYPECRYPEILISSLVGGHWMAHIKGVGSQEKRKKPGTYYCGRLSLQAQSHFPLSYEFSPETPGISSEGKELFGTRKNTGECFCRRTFQVRAVERARRH